MRAQNFTMFAGDSKKLNVTLYDEQGGVLPISGASFLLRLFMPTTILKAGRVTNGDKGGMLVELEPSDTEGLSGEYRYELEMTDVQGNVSTVVHGYIVIKR